MQNLFLPDTNTRPDKHHDVTKPLPRGLAEILSHPQKAVHNRRLRRLGLAFVWAPASKPARHTVCAVCGRRTFTSARATCRKCFLSGNGPIDEVTFNAQG